MKRLIDIVFSFIAICLLSPFFVAAAVLVRINLGGPVLFKQTRAGLYGRPFLLYKFRTMNNAIDECGVALPDECRLTAFGAFLRSTSLDELPQLWCVLKGDMSLVGPRPLFVKYIPLYNSFQKRRLEVLPGITGWAQVNGRNDLSWVDKFKFDVWYVDNLSIKLDFLILLLTVKNVLLRQGISAKGAATMPHFSGDQS